MVYQGIIGGARGVVYFAWHVPPIGISSNLRLMDAIEGINRELSGLAGFVVGGRRTLVPSVPPDDDVKAALFTTGKTSLLIATNVGAISKRCTLESPLMRDADVLSGNATANRGTVHLTLQPYEVALVRMSSRN